MAAHCASNTAWRSDLRMLEAVGPSQRDVGPVARVSQTNGHVWMKFTWIYQSNIVFSPPVRWGLLDFMYALRLLLVLFFFFFFFLLFSSSPRLRRHPRRPLRQMSPDVNMDLQIAVGSAGPQGQRRTSTGGLWSGLGNAGPHPGTSRAEWAAPDLSCQKICQKSARQECQKICQKKCRKICQ